MALARYASRAARSRGRAVAEPAAPGRSAYQRDRDRIIHCSAFRRLEYKTQVFLNHEGDHFRTRLTHTIEVAQIARTVARMLRLEEDLTEAIALAHDLGHTPFGHAGQDALNACMQRHGGFEHNLQSLRVVTLLEQRYPQWDGLNLSFETLEGILKHCSVRNARQLGRLGERFLRKEQPSLEAQVANLADEIAYTSHDIDDGLSSGLLSIDQLRTVPLIESLWAGTLDRFPHLDDKRACLQVIRDLTNRMVRDLVESTEAMLAGVAPLDAQAIRLAGPIAAFSPGLQAQVRPLRKLLFQRLYRHPKVDEKMQAAGRVVAELFDAYSAEPAQLPAHHREAVARGHALHRTVADYIAGMTDRFALREHARLFGEQLSVRLTQR